MEGHLYLEARIGMVESATDFTYKWCVNMGLDAGESARMALAVDEVLTDIILYAYPGEKKGYMELWFQYSLSGIEIIINETGEPFDPELHPYSREKSIATGDFEGAGLEIARRMTDHFLFLNRGKNGKEFRLVKHFFNSHIGKLIDTDATVCWQGANDPPGDETYHYISVSSGDEEDIAKLIHASYEYTYGKDDLYFPKRIETSLRYGYKFGVMAKTSGGIPAGYFAVIRNPDSHIGEVGEAVVAPHHRKRGLMKRMLQELIELSRQKGLIGLYGLALTIHTISQKVNEQFGFKSTALILAKSPGAIYKDLREDYPQRISMIADFMPLTDSWDSPVYLPGKYHSVLSAIYEQFDRHPTLRTIPKNISREEAPTDLNLKIYYESDTALIVVYVIGRTFEATCQAMLKSIEELRLAAIYVDLPLNHPWSEPAVDWLHNQEFILSGLMPLHHREQDFFRMQKIDAELDFDLIDVHTKTARLLKGIISHEYRTVQKKQAQT